MLNPLLEGVLQKGKKDGYGATDAFVRQTIITLGELRKLALIGTLPSDPTAGPLADAVDLLREPLDDYERLRKDIK